MTLLTRLFRPAPPSISTQTEAAVPSEPPQIAASALSDEELVRVEHAIQVGDGELLGKLAIDGATTKVRQLAADAIHDPAQLKLLLRDVRGKDKNVYKIIRGKCDVLLAEEKAAADIQTTINSLNIALQHHSHLPFDNLYTPTLEHLESQWHLVVAHADSDIKIQTESAIDRCREIVTGHIQQIASQAAHANAVAQADANRQLVLDDLRQQLLAAYATELTVFESRACIARWNELEQFKAANSHDTAQFKQLRQTITEVIRLIAQHGTPAQQAEQFATNSEQDLTTAARTLKQTLLHSSLLGDAIPAALTEAVAALHAWHQARTEHEAAHAQALRQLGGLIRKTLGALNDGKTAPAAGMRRAVEEKLQHIPNPPAHIVNQLTQLDEKLALLQDWRSYAVAPKRIELIEQIEALGGSSEDPNTLAEKIKRLQEEWKVISKGNIDNTDAEWQRFHQAAQTAYQPCRDYFAAQAKQRQVNLEKRSALLARLTAFVDAQNWESPDWREVARALRESKQQWRNYQPIERVANKPLQQSFEALTANLQTRLESEYSKNATEKQRLITRAQHLLTQDDSRSAIEDVKRLQLAWKDIGSVTRHDEQALWEEFRRHCDAVFAKRQQQHGEHMANLDANKQQALAICETVEQLQVLSGTELVEAIKQLPTLRESFAAVSDLPKANAYELQKRFERAVTRCEKNLTQQRARDKARAWDQLLEAGNKLRLYRVAAMRNSPTEAQEAQQVLQTFIDSVQHWPKGGLQAIKTELMKTATDDVDVNTTALRTLCIRAEILTDTPTPAEDHAFRRNYQVQRLMQTMGQGQSSDKNELDAMVFEWIAVGATNDDTYTELLARFNRCRAASLK